MSLDINEPEHKLTRDQIRSDDHYRGMAVPAVGGHRRASAGIASTEDFVAKDGRTRECATPTI